MLRKAGVQLKIKNTPRELRHRSVPKQAGPNALPTIWQGECRAVAGGAADDVSRGLRGPSG